MIFLDCTLRDGGYYNKWNFNPEDAKNLIASLNKAGVQIIEVGYKSPEAENSFYGLFKYCNEDYLSFLSKDDQADYAFMIDVKDFIKEGTIDEEGLDKVIRSETESIFSWVRLASHYATIDTIPAFQKYFKSKGYKIGFNLMGGSLLSKEQIKEGLKIAEQSKVDVFYLADSFGSFYPNDIRELVKFAKANYSGPIGIHTHDNQGMAYANTLAAIDEGVEFVDGTVTGMGRGAGNLLTEQFLIGYSKKYNDQRFNGNALLKIIEEYIQPMKNKYMWGYNPTYMYSGLHNIHPTYCQNLIESGRYTIEEISGILAAIPSESRTKFNLSSLEKAVKYQLKSEMSEESESASRRFNLEELKSPTVVIVARGENVKPHIRNIVSLVKRRGYKLIECNDTGLFNAEDERVIAILNQVRLREWLSRSNNSSANSLVSGFPVNVSKGGYLPFKIGDFDIPNGKIIIPDYDAGLYAIAVAIKAGVRNILLAGFDGFEDDSLNKIKEMQLKQISQHIQRAGITISHITPTRYNIFNEKSLYTY